MISADSEAAQVVEHGLESQIKWPTLVIRQSQGFPLVGVPELRLDGEPFPFPTLGEWRLEFSEDSIASVTVRIPVLVEVEPRP